MCGDKNYVSCRHFCDNFLDYDGESININDQKDVFEFYTLFMDKLESQFRNEKHNFIKSELTGQLSTQIIS